MVASCAPPSGAIGSPPQLALAPKLGQRAPKYRVLYSFQGTPDGGNPEMGLTVMDGKLYGTSYTGGADGEGAVFQITSDGHEKVLYSFKAFTDGAKPYAGLTAVNGKLYGVTTSGGRGRCDFGTYGYGSGCGTVFSLDASGREQILYKFRGTNDGSTPQTNLVPIGNELYGTTAFAGGPPCTVVNGCGTVFAVSLSGKHRTVYRFLGGGSAADGDRPIGNMTYANGTLYGTTNAGGVNWEGTVYAVTPSGAEHVLYAFEGGNDGGAPRGGVVMDGTTLYGVTFSGGGTGCRNGVGCGTVFSMTTSGSEKILKQFGNGADDGGNPFENLVELHGLFYGTTMAGGPAHCTGDSFGCGTLFTIGKDGNYRILHAFAGGSDGADPQGQLVELNGAYYGTTFIGGTHNVGTVYEIKP